MVTNEYFPIKYPRFSFLDIYFCPIFIFQKNFTPKILIFDTTCEGNFFRHFSKISLFTLHYVVKIKGLYKYHLKISLDKTLKYSFIGNLNYVNLTKKYNFYKIKTNKKH